MRFCSPNDLTAMIGLDKDAANYAALEVLQDGMQSLFEAYLNRELERKERAVDVHVTGSMIPLQGLPVRSVASVSVIDSYGTTSSLSATDYIITPYGLKLHVKVQGSAYVSVTYTGGLAVLNGIATSTDAMDEKLVRSLDRAALQQVHYEWTRKDKLGATAISTEGGNVSFPELNILKTVRQILDAHKHPLWEFS